MLDYAKIEDSELFSLVKRKDAAAYKEVYARYWEPLYRHAFTMLGSDEDAKDIVQELFFSLWERSIEITIQTSLSSYLYASVRNKVLNLIEKNRVRKEYALFYEKTADAYECITDHALRERELKRLIEAEVNKLPEKMRNVFELSRNDHKSYKQIAESLDISEKTVKKQISNALKILRVKLGSLISFFIVAFISSF